MKTSDKLFNAWFVAGLLLIAVAGGGAGTMFFLHLVGPWWLVMLLCVVALLGVWCFGMAEETWDEAAREAAARANPDPEFGPERYAAPAARYTGPERRRRDRNPPRPHLRVISPEDAHRRCGTPPGVDEVV